MKSLISATVIVGTLCWSLVAVATGQAASKSTFAISGCVVDVHGVSVPDAIVDIVDLRGSFDHPVPPARTMEDGCFEGRVTSVGKYKLLVWKADANVPNPYISINESPEVDYPLVEVTSDKPVRNIRLTLPRSFGRLTGRVVDDKTGAAITTARVTLTDADKPAIYLSKQIENDGNVNILLPPKPIDAVIVAPGYKSWSLRNHLPSARPIVLRSGDVKDLEVRLQADK